MDEKYTHFPKTAFRPIGKPSKVKQHDVTPTDRTMLSMAKNIAGERGENDSMSAEFVYRRMEQRQRMAINKSAMGSDKKALNRFYTHKMGGVYNANEYSHMYGLYQDGEDNMFENAKPMEMKAGDIVYNNRLGEIGVLQDNQSRGDNCFLVFQDRSFTVNKAEHGWSKKKIFQDEGIVSEPAPSTPHAASSAANGALFKEQVESPHKKFVDETMKKIMVEVESQDHPLVPKSEWNKGVKAEMEHKDTIQKIKNEDLSPKEAAEEIVKDHLKENPEYYKKMKTGGKEFLISQDGDDDYSEDEVTEIKAEYADDMQTPTAAANPRKAQLTGAMHSYPGGHAEFHKQIGGALASQNVPVGSRVRVQSPSGAVFHGKYQGAGLPLKHASGDKPATHYENMFKGFATNTFSHNDHTVSFVPPGMTPKETSPLSRSSQISPDVAKKVSYIPTTKEGKPASMHNIPSVKYEAPEHPKPAAPIGDHMSHWKSVAANKQSEVNAIMAKPKPTSAEMQKASRHMEDIAHANKFFKMVEEHPEHLHATETSITGQPRTLAKQVTERNVAESIRAGEHARAQPSPGPFKSSEDKSKWSRGVMPSGTDRESKVKRDFISDVTKSEPIVPRQTGETKGAALDIKEHHKILAKTNPDVTLHYANEKGEIVHQAQTKYSDLPSEIMRHHEKHGMPTATFVHGNIAGSAKTSKIDTSYGGIVGAAIASKKTEDLFKIHMKGSQDVKPSTVPLTKKITDKFGQKHEVKTVESGWNKLGYDGSGRVPKMAGPALGPRFGGITVQKGKPIIKKVGVPTAKSGNQGMGSSLSTQILGGASFLGKSAAETRAAGAHMRGGVSPGMRQQEYNINKEIFKKQEEVAPKEKKPTLPGDVSKKQLGLKDEDIKVN